MYKSIETFYLNTLFLPYLSYFFLEYNLLTPLSINILIL